MAKILLLLLNNTMGYQSLCYDKQMEDCVFCKIVSGAEPSHKIYEDDEFLAFLSIAPNTDGVTVVIPKKHYSSYVFDLPEDVYHKLLDATRKVAKQLDSKFDDSNWTALVFEGFEINHVHAKLYPLHGTAHLAEWKSILSKNPEFNKQYPGYVTTRSGPRAKDTELEKLAKKLRD